MAKYVHYIELSNAIRFDAANQLTDVFFDDSNKQIFSVRSGGVVVKGPTEDNIKSFRMSDSGAIRSIKFSSDNQILGLQRRENAVEFIFFQDDQPLLDNVCVHQVKALIYGFVWINIRDCALISNSGVEILTALPQRKQVKSVKTMDIGIQWFAWCSETSIAILRTLDTDNTLRPILMKQKTITKLPKLELGATSREVQDNKVTLAQIYGVMAVLIIQSNAAAMIEVEVYLLNGPGLAPRKCHILQLGRLGRYAINTVDNLIVVHHQALAISLLFDIAASGEVRNDITYHKPVTAGKTIKPFDLNLPSLLPGGQTLQCELYSTNWVLFQPNIVIDAKLGYMWNLELQLEFMCTSIPDRIKLIEFLLRRKNAKQAVLKLLRQMVDEQYDGKLLGLLETMFDNINNIYASWINMELQNQIAQPSNVKTTAKQPVSYKVLIDQDDMHEHVFLHIVEKPQCESIITLYLLSLHQYNITAQESISKDVIKTLIFNKKFEALRDMVANSMLMESKAVACFLISYSNEDIAITQLALDMLSKIKAHNTIVEILLEQGKVIDALRLTKNTKTSNSASERISPRKFLEAALKTKDDLIYHSVYKFFQLRNLEEYGSTEFLKTDQCSEFVRHYNSLYGSSR